MTSGRYRIQRHFRDAYKPPIRALRHQLMRRPTHWPFWRKARQADVQMKSPYGRRLAGGFLANGPQSPQDGAAMNDGAKPGKAAGDPSSALIRACEP